MKILRTPCERFASLPGYGFAPHWFDSARHTGILNRKRVPLRMHYLDEGPKDGTPLILLHGEPTWSYLYRKMIPPLVSAEFRIIAPDLIGFGKSDKPAAVEDYTYANHEEWLGDLLEHLDVKNAIPFCQDWGGLIGLRLVAKWGVSRFSRVVVSNTFLPVCDDSFFRINDTFYR